MEKSSGHKIKILIVDDHNVVREGLRRILELDGTMEVIGEAQIWSYRGCTNLDSAAALGESQRQTMRL